MTISQKYRLYEQKKRDWAMKNPKASPHECLAAYHRIAKEVGL